VSGVPRLRLLLLATAVATLLAGAPAAALGSGRDVLRDCTDDEVMSKTYTQKEYRDALSQLAADADQYGNCRQVIRRAQLRAAAAAAGDRSGGSGSGSPGAPAGGGAGPSGGDGGTSGGGGAIGSAPAGEQLRSATPAERSAIEDARTAAGRSFELDNARVDPDKVGAVPGVSQVSDLPAPLVAVLALLLAAALALAALRIRSLVHARRA
jgi:hypothetical protein